jgi:hypothetical protein
MLPKADSENGQPSWTANADNEVFSKDEDTTPQSRLFEKTDAFRAICFEFEQIETPGKAKSCT